MIKNLGYRKLSRTSSHRKAMLANMTVSLLLAEEVETTVAKAKELKSFADRVITDAKRGRRVEVRRVLKNNKAVSKKLFDIIVPRYEKRSGGYTRLVRLGIRRGDSARMSLVKLV
jgi:large subunit ribosomal protein L17